MHRRCAPPAYSWAGRHQVHQLSAFEAGEPVLDAGVGLDLLVRLEQLGCLQPLQDRVLLVRQRQQAASTGRRSHQLRARRSPRRQPTQRKPSAWHMWQLRRESSRIEEWTVEPLGNPMP